jgi:hypothetical protein
MVIAVLYSGHTMCAEQSGKDLAARPPTPGDPLKKPPVNKLDFGRAARYVAVQPSSRSLSAAPEQKERRSLERRSPVLLLQVPNDGIKITSFDDVIAQSPRGERLSPRSQRRSPRSSQTPSSNQPSTLSFSNDSQETQHEEKSKNELQQQRIFSQAETEELRAQVRQLFEKNASKIFKERVEQAVVGKSKRDRPQLSSERENADWYNKTHQELSNEYAKIFIDIFQKVHHPDGFHDELPVLKANAISKAWLDKALPEALAEQLRNNPRKFKQCVIL